MPKNPPRGRSRLFTTLTRATIMQLAAPLSAYSSCESAAFMRAAISKPETQPFFPNDVKVALGAPFQRSGDTLHAIKTEAHRKQAAISAASSLRNARTLFEQAALISEQARSILYYYGALSVLDFFMVSLVRRERVGNPGHGLSLSADSAGWDFDRGWPRNKCRAEVGTVGDFPFYVDALTVAGFPSLFSGFRLHQETKLSPLEVKKNPAPLLKWHAASGAFPGNKESLSFLCNFDWDRFLRDSPDVRDWLIGADSEMVWKMTWLLLDFIIVFAASSLARYYTPAWRDVVTGEKSDIYNDIRVAYTSVSEDLPYYFEDEHPFADGFVTRIR